jgi:hypothetical protein
MGRLVAAILLSGFVSSMTDWFFGGVLFHKKYLAFPEVWRRQAGQPGEGKAIAWAVLLGFVTCAAFILTTVWLGIHGYGAALRLALAMWIIAPLPLMITNALFIKLHPLNVVANSLGWLVKLLLAGAAAGWV